MVIAATKSWTRQEVLALPDDGMRHELVDGELLVSPAPRGRHQRGVFELAMLLVGDLGGIRGHSGRERWAAGGAAAGWMRGSTALPPRR